jgi:hypothetical protein
MAAALKGHSALGAWEIVNELEGSVYSGKVSTLWIFELHRTKLFSKKVARVGERTQGSFDFRLFSHRSTAETQRLPI